MTRKHNQLSPRESGQPYGSKRANHEHSQQHMALSAGNEPDRQRLQTLAAILPELAISQYLNDPRTIIILSRSAVLSQPQSTQSRTEPPVEEDSMETIYTIPEVAAYLKMSKTKVYEMVNRNQIPFIRIGRNVRIRESDLVAWLEEQAQYEEPSFWSSLPKAT